MASRLPWNRPGASGEPTSAITSMVMSVGVMPTSVACSVTLAHGLGAAVVALAAAVVGAAAAVVAGGLLELLREQAPASTQTATSAVSATERFTGPPCNRPSPPYSRDRVECPRAGTCPPAGPLGHWADGPLGRLATGPTGRSAARPLGARLLGARPTGAAGGRPSPARPRPSPRWTSR